jgi:exodeoxyribonuclease VII large subunit
LFPFNHPDVVRAIVACPVPVVSAIGHEVDVTLSDLAADLRAATPSAAAELVVPDRLVLTVRLQELKSQLNASLQARVVWAQDQVSDLRDRLRPQRFCRKIEERKQNLADLSDRLERAFSNRLEHEHLLLKEMNTALDSRNPLAVLARGYCVAEKQGVIVRSADAITKGDNMNIRFYNGSSLVTVEQVDHERDL